MNRRAHSSGGLRLALVLFALLASVGAAPASSAAPQPAPGSIGTASAPPPESEPNNTVNQADLLVFSGNTAATAGTIDSVSDQSGTFGDWYRFTTLAGSRVTITLSSLPAD